MTAKGQFLNPKKPHNGGKANEAHERKVFSSVTEVVKFDAKDLQIAVYGDVANLTFHSDFQLKFGDDLVVVNDQITLLFVKTNDGSRTSFTFEKLTNNRRRNTMKKTLICSTALFIALMFVGCEDDPVSSKYYPPDTTARSKIVTSGFRYNGLNREYTVFLPKYYKSNMPLVLNLHAANMTMARWMSYTRMNGVADTAGFIVVYPSGGSNWNGTTLRNENVGFISTLIDTLKTKYNIDMSRVYCSGASSGGFMTYTLLGELGHRFAAAASVAASLFDNAANWKLNKFTPLLIISGTHDQIVPYHGDKNLGRWSAEKTINYWLQNYNCSPGADTLLLPDNDKTDNSTIEKISWTNCSDNSSIVFYKVIGGAHHWPGGNIELTTIGGNLNNDINSSAEMWNFFKNYSNPLVK